MDATNDDSKAGEPVCPEGKIKLLVRTARVQKHIIIDEDITVADLRSKTAELFEVEDSNLTVLIFGGKILKDADDIKTHGIKDGQTVHLVIRNRPQGENSGANVSSNETNQQSNVRSSPDVQTQSSNSNINLDNRANPLLGNLGDVQQRLQQMLISNPETVQNVLNPMMQQMMNNPDMLRSLFGSMQRMQSLVERNPEVNHLLSNPDVLRESLEMVRNPAALQEVMRNYDRALNNMESMPGGYNVLRRMYTEFQEPLMSAFQEQFNTNQFPSQTNSGNSNESEQSNNDGQQRTENRDPLPNPWAASGQNNRLGFPSNLLGGGTNLEGQANAGSSDLLQHADNILQNQEFISLLTNPEAIQSIEQIQQGCERLQRIAPNLFGRLGLANLPRVGSLNQNTDNAEGQPASNQQAGGQLNPGAMSQLFRQLFGASTGGASNTNSTTTSNPDSTNVQQAARTFAQLLASRGAAGTGAASDMGNPIGVDSTPPEDRYSQQLQQLSEMGFTNREANLRALIETFGDINAAIARLLPQ